MKVCEWCSDEFKPAVKFQIYCSSECREASTKEKIIRRYQINKVKQRKGKERLCAGGCGIMISIYNDEKFCSACKINVEKVEKALGKIKGMSKDK